MRKYSKQWHTYNTLRGKVAKRFGDAGFVNDNLTVDVKGPVELTSADVLNHKMAYKFGVVNGAFVARNLKLYTLIGSPSHVDGTYDVAGSELTDLTGLPKYVTGQICMRGCQLTSLKNIHKLVKHVTSIDMHLNPITSHVLGLLLIPHLERAYLDNKKVGKIINAHLKGERNAFACQEELIQAGFAEFAKV